MERMNPGLQKHVLKNKLESEGIKSDTVDVHAHMDRSLSLPENVTQFEEKFNLGRSEMDEEEFSSKQRKATISEARKIHNQRPKFNRMIDEAINADRVFKNPTEKQFEMWRSNPDKFDIQGVDSRLPGEQRTRAKVPANRMRQNKKDLFAAEKRSEDIRKRNQPLRNIPNPTPLGKAERMKLKEEEEMFKEKFNPEEALNVDGGMAAVQHEKLI